MISSRFLFLFLFSLGLSLKLYPQENRLELGFMIGPNLISKSGFTLEPNQAFDMHGGRNVGAFAFYNLLRKEKFELKLGVISANKNYHVTLNRLDQNSLFQGDFKFSKGMWYLGIPFLLSYKLDVFSFKYPLNIGAGLSLYQLRSTSTTYAATEIAPDKYEVQPGDTIFYAFSGTGDFLNKFGLEPLLYLSNQVGNRFMVSAIFTLGIFQSPSDSFAGYIKTNQINYAYKAEFSPRISSLSFGIGWRIL